MHWGMVKKPIHLLNDGWNKNALKYDPKNDLENSGLSKKMTNIKMIIGIKMRVNMEKKIFL